MRPPTVGRLYDVPFGGGGCCCLLGVRCCCRVCVGGGGEGVCVWGGGEERAFGRVPGAAVRACWERPRPARHHSPHHTLTHAPPHTQTTLTQVVLDVAAARVLAAPPPPPPPPLPAGNPLFPPHTLTQVVLDVAAARVLAARALHLAAAELAEDLRHRLAHDVGEDVEPAFGGLVGRVCGGVGVRGGACTRV